ncbi:MAG: aldose 1-epimerase [Acetivibrionales bacterium]|jgi:hypothetical protein
MNYSSGRNHGCRITEYVHRGLKILVMENDLIKMAVLLDKGADIVELLYKPLDIDFMWKSPCGIREFGKHIPSSSSSMGNFLDFYEGGWQEILPGGGPCTYYGAELGLHGESSLIPWDFYVQEDGIDCISVVFTCSLVRTPLHIKKTITLRKGSTIIDIKELLKNESSENIDFMWGHHPAIGEPFLCGDCRIDVPAKRFTASGLSYSPTSNFESGRHGKWPQEKGINGEMIDLSVMPSGEVPTADLFFLEGLEDGWYAVTNGKMKLGIGFCWDISVFPYVWYWQVCRGLSGYPWYGRTYNIALEPWTSIPGNFEEARQNCTTKTIGANGTIQTSLKAVIYEGLDRVKSISQEGEVT